VRIDSVRAQSKRPTQTSIPPGAAPFTCPRGGGKLSPPPKKSFPKPCVFIRRRFQWPQRQKQPAILSRAVSGCGRLAVTSSASVLAWARHAELVRHAGPVPRAEPVPRAGQARRAERAPHEEPAFRAGQAPREGPALCVRPALAPCEPPASERPSVPSSASALLWVPPSLAWEQPLVPSSACCLEPQPWEQRPRAAGPSSAWLPPPSPACRGCC